MQVVTYYFKRFSLLPYYFVLKNHAAQVFLYLFFCAFLLKNRKKYANFLQFFLVVYQQVTRKLKKKLLETLDKILNCCIFASSFKIKQKQQQNNDNNSNNKKTKRNDNKKN